MSGSAHLCQLLIVLLDHGQWQDLRHLKRAANMIAGLLLSESVNLTKWIPFAETRAEIAQSIQRGFARWLSNDNIKTEELYAPLIQSALADWGEHKLYLAFDTSMLWNQFCIVRISVVYKGRAIPLVWKVLEHGSASVAYEDYKELLTRAEKLLPVFVKKVILLADRGFVHVKLMKRCRQLGWGFRIRCKNDINIYRKGYKIGKTGDFAPIKPGNALFMHNVRITDELFGVVHPAIAYDNESGEIWYIISDKRTNKKTFKEYGLRFDIEENFLDEKSNGFQLESSKIRSAAALNRLCFITAVSTLFLVSQGTKVVAEGKRRVVDPHWFRGSSYLKIGWNWLKHALNKGWALITSFNLYGGDDPDPAKASRSQYEKQRTKFDNFDCETIDYKQ